MRAAVLALFAAGCTIEAGAVPDAAACAPSPDFFVSDVVSRYFFSNQCANEGCHAFAGGHGLLRLRFDESPPFPTTPLESWPLSWRESYLSTIQVLRCDAPLESRLLTVPEGLGNLHPPGPVVLDREDAAELVQAWVLLP